MSNYLIQIKKQTLQRETDILFKVCLHLHTPKKHYLTSTIVVIALLYISNRIENLPTVTEEKLIIACKKGNRLAQKELYNRYAPKMYGVCLRYIGDSTEAEDVLVEALFKVLTKLEKYSGAGSFEGWIRRIVINESLMYLRKKKQTNYHLQIEQDHIQVATDENIDANLAAEDIIKLLDQLTIGYRTVFNLYVIEGYKHKEIAELLGISINTSKSQLIMARKKLKHLIVESQIEH